jgi:L-cysteine/cystine lyase
MARVFNASPEEVMLTHGTTEGVHVVLYGLEWQAGDELVTCALEHPALASPASVLEERYGVVSKRVVVPSDADEDAQLKAIVDAITPKTRVVALSHIQYSCGLRMPIREIAEAAHRNGALVLVDGAQTGGHIALDPRALGADFYAISGQKWLLGPQGTGALYVAREHARTIAPLFQTHAIADARAEMGEYAGGASPLARFRVTSQSTALTAGLGEAARILLDIGMGTVEEHNNDLAAKMRAGLAAIPGTTLTGPREGSATCGLVSVAVAGWEPRQVVEALWDRWRIAGRAVNSPAAVRFSCHVFNTDAEVAAVVRAIGEIVKEEAPALVEAAH